MLPRPPSCYGVGWRFGINVVGDSVPPCSLPVPLSCFEAGWVEVFDRNLMRQKTLATNLILVKSLTSLQDKLLVPSRFAESRFAESRFAESRFSEFHFAESRFAESRFTEFRYSYLFIAISYLTTTLFHIIAAI